MTKILLGVNDVPYVEGGETPRYRVKGLGKRGIKPRVYKIASTTGDVAEILEAKYGVMSVFFEMYAYQIAGALEEEIQGALENLMMGAPSVKDPLVGVTSKIKEWFSKFIMEEQVEKLGIPGVPTEAAKRGVSHRFKHPYARRPKRASFYDTGLYERSFSAEIEA